MKKKRRRYLVNPRYQLSQGGIIVISHLLVALFIAGLLSWFYLFIMHGGVSCSHNREIIWYLVMGAFVVMLSTAAWVVGHSHSVAGMVIKIERTLSDMAEGRLPGEPVLFRKGDHFAWLESPLNRCIKAMKAYRKDRQFVLASLETTRERLSSKKISCQEAAEEIERLLGDLGTMRK